MVLKRLSSIGALVVLGLVNAGPAHADEQTNASVTFFHSPGAEADWVHFTPAPPGDPDTWSIKLSLPTTVDYAGADIHGVTGAPPANPPSFDFYSTIAGNSGGSPRLVMIFSSNSNAQQSDMELRPLVWTAGTWTHQDGSGANWDVHSPTCPFLYASTYSAGLACHSGETVTDVFVVTDSAWVQGPYTHYIDNISYGGALITSPEGKGCHESDGDGHFHGDKGNADVHVDSDGCIDGDQDSVDSQNRGDGQDFHSTQINSVAVDSLTNTLTVTGTGTSNGVPMTFTLVAVPATALTPGWVSYTFGDGYTNAGSLLDGAISLS